MLVKESFNKISVSLLGEMAADDSLSEDESDYWKSSQKFWDQVKDVAIGRMSTKQISWIQRIETDLIDIAGQG